MKQKWRRIVSRLLKNAHLLTPRPLQRGLRRKPRQSEYFYYVCLIPQLLRALHLDIFEQPVQSRVFQQAVGNVALGGRIESVPC